MLRASSALIASAVALSLGACAKDEGEYPSLARRPIERISTVAGPSPTPSATPAPPSAELVAKLDGLVAQAARADARFHAHEGRARQLVAAASGAAVASEGWSVATVAVADLESARSDAMIALAEIDALYAAARINGEDAALIALARDHVTGLVDSEDKVLADLRGRIAS
jgi:hypothetical protein